MKKVFDSNDFFQLNNCLDLEKNINATNDNNKKKNKNLSMISENDNVNLRAAMMHILGT